MNQINEKAFETHAGGSPIESTRTIKVWDLPVRIFHWSLVILFVAAYLTNAMGAEYFKYHVWTGYAIIVLVAFRLLWGFVGTYHARFFNFVRNPFTTAKYGIDFLKKKEAHHLGHNPLGAVMVIVLLLTLLAQATTGLFGNDEIFNLGPLYGYVSNDLSLTLTSVHRQLFYWILGAVVLHIVAVLIHVFLKRDNIVKAMFTGKKSVPYSSTEKPITGSRILLALVIVIVLAAALAWVIHSAPEAVSDLG